MKKVLSFVAAIALATTVAIGNFDAATASRAINADACEDVYTNYYIFLEANTEEYFNEVKFSNTRHSDVAEYLNNYYQISNFSTVNVGYGQTTVTTNSSNSLDGITSMSLEEFYRIYTKSGRTNGAFTEGKNNYIVSHNWYRVVNGVEEKGGAGLDLTNYAIRDLAAASINASITITRNTDIAYRYENPFRLQIERLYTGYLTGTPIKHDNANWYLQPAVYYVQYCSPKTYEKYTVSYNGNSSNVTNVPAAHSAYEDECTNISSVKPTRAGYTFLGWSLNSSSTVANATYAPGRSYCGERGDIVLYAVWKENEVVTPVDTYYTITYDSNAADTVLNMPNNAKINTNSDAYIASETPTRSGYTFMGWSPDARVSTGDVNFKPGSLYSARKDLVLYAIWQKNDTSTPTIPDNPKTGVSDYLLPFGGVVSASGLGLGILKKKKSFKQF